MEKRKKPTLERATWPTRHAMVMHGLAMNLPWLAFVNISFAVMILLRHILLENSDMLYPGSRQLTRIVDASMLGIIILSVTLVIMAWPMASLESESLSLPATLSPGLSFR